METKAQINNSTPNLTGISVDSPKDTSYKIPRGAKTRFTRRSLDELDHASSAKTHSTDKKLDTPKDKWSLSNSFNKLFQPKVASPKGSAYFSSSSSLESDGDFSSILPSRAKESRHAFMSAGTTQRIESLANLYMQLKEPGTGIKFSNYKLSFKGSIDNAFSGTDLIEWFGPFETDMQFQDAITICNLLFYMGFIVSLDRHPTFIEANSFYILQRPRLLPSPDWSPSDFDYARFLLRRNRVYSVKYGLLPYEIEVIEKMHTRYQARWEALENAVDKDIKFLEGIKRESSKIYRLQEFAFWNVYRPSEESVAKFLDQEAVILKKKRFSLKDHEDTLTKSDLLVWTEKRLSHLKESEASIRLKTSVTVSQLIQYCQAREMVDPLLSEIMPSNPWISDDTSRWTQPRTPTINDVRYWKTSLHSLLNDELGLDYFKRFLKSEFSDENLQFVLDVKNLERCSNHAEYNLKANAIYQEYIQEGSSREINIVASIKKKLKLLFATGTLAPADYDCFEAATEHILCLMEKDSYMRFCKSDFWKSSGRSDTTAH